MELHNVSKSNPKYKNIDLLVNIKLDNLDVKMQPVTINEILKFVRNTKPG